MRVLATAAVLGLAVLAGCAAPGADGGDATPPLTADGKLDFGVPGGLVEVVDDVGYYPACGNEVLVFEGDAYYPYRPVDQEGFPNPTETGDLEPQESAPATTSLGFARASAPRAAVPMVVAPGPGDDVGSLYVYEGGHAHWRSESGDLQTWLTTTPIEYQWAC